MESRAFAVVTGASTGIGYELARRCAEHGFDLLIAADEPAMLDTKVGQHRQKAEPGSGNR